MTFNSHGLKQISWLRTDHSEGCWRLGSLALVAEHAKGSEMMRVFVGNIINRHCVDFCLFAVIVQSSSLWRRWPHQRFHFWSRVIHSQWSRERLQKPHW